MSSRTLVSGGVTGSVAILLFGLVFFIRTQDALVLMSAGRLIVGLWVILLIVHVIRHGIPVRVVRDETLAGDRGKGV